MHSDTRKLLTHLFAEMTARLENASTIAGAGQSHRASARQYRAYARNLARVADELGHIARAAEALTRPVPAPRKFARMFAKRTGLALQTERVWVSRKGRSGPQPRTR